MLQSLTSSSLLDKIGKLPETRNLIITTSITTIILLILALLLTRQLIFFDNTIQTLIFLIIVFFGYGVSSWVILKYTGRTTKQLRSKSPFVRSIHSWIIVTQSVLLIILILVIYYNTAYCQGYFSMCMGARIPAVFVNAIASTSAAALLGMFSYKLFVRYKNDKRNFLLLFFGLTTATLSMSIGGDAFDKIVVQQVIVERTPRSSDTVEQITPQSSFIYKTFESYDGAKIQYKVTEPDGTSTLYMVPSSLGPLHKAIVVLTSTPKHVLLWISTMILLFLYYHRTNNRLRNLAAKHWILLSMPLVLFLVGSGLIFSLPSDSEFRYYERILYRTGSIGSSIMYGFVFYILTKDIPSNKVKDYLYVTAIGIVMIGISFSISALQQTYGTAGHSFLLLSSYLFVVGLYASGIFLSQDSRFRDYIKKLADKETILLINNGNTPLLEIKQVIERRVMNTIRKREQDIIDDDLMGTSLTEQEASQYLSYVIKESRVLKDYVQILKKEKHMLEESNEYLTCLSPRTLKSMNNNSFYVDGYKNVLERHKKGLHKGIKWVTTVDKETTNMIKPFVEMGVQVRHVNSLPPIDFSVSDLEMIARVQHLEHLNQPLTEPMYDNKGSPSVIKNILVTNEPVYVDYFISIFKDLWSNGVDARERMKFIE